MYVCMYIDKNRGHPFFTTICMCLAKNKKRDDDDNAASCAATCYQTQKPIHCVKIKHTHTHRNLQKKNLDN